MSKQNWCNAAQVFIAGCISIVLATVFLKPSFYKSLLGLEHINLIEIELSGSPMWTLITAFISSPVAFAVWRLRDKNVSEQIENARKDTNLKEFQKLAEWVSGTHFVDETPKDSSQLNELAIQTYNKIDGAVGLQIAAIYNLLPFYRGDHGKSFKKPTLNLLTSAWLALQSKELVILDKKESSEDEKNQAIKKLKYNAESPLGIAITRVLLSLNAQGKPCLSEHKEIFPGLCLAGMNFHISSVDKTCLSVFKYSNCSKINMIGANLEKADLTRAELTYANFTKADLTEAALTKADLTEANLTEANLTKADLTEATLTKADLTEADLTEADLTEADLTEADLTEATLTKADLTEANFTKATLTKADLTETNLTKADLTETNLTEATLTKADLTKAKLGRNLLNQLLGYKQASQHI